MLSVVLTVLKIIGIIVLCLLLTILVVAGLILFVPIRYRASGYYHGDYAVKGRLSWLFHLITVKVMLQQNSELELMVRFLGIPVYDLQKKKLKAEKAKKNNAKEVEPEEEVEELKDAKPPVPHRPGSEVKKTQEEITLKIDAPREDASNDIPKQEPGTKKHKGFRPLQKCRELAGKWKAFSEKVKYTFHTICDKIKEIKGNITYYINLFQEESTKCALVACKKELLRIWKDIKPRRFKVNVLLGMEDPATTGQVVGYCAMLYPLHNGNIVIVPDFEQSQFEADFSMKGKITVYVYLMVAYTLLFNKNIKHFKKCLLREDS